MGLSSFGLEFHFRAPKLPNREQIVPANSNQRLSILIFLLIFFFCQDQAFLEEPYSKPSCTVSPHRKKVIRATLSLNASTSGTPMVHET